MDFLNWYDWLGPTNPAAAVFFGFMITIIVALTVWFDTKKLRTAGFAALTGIFVTLVGVFVLNASGFYG
jgi:phosphoglycerol transferase MdoB-like AlkP superfamily enzyme